MKTGIKIVGSIALAILVAYFIKRHVLGNQMIVTYDYNTGILNLKKGDIVNVVPYQKGYTILGIKDSYITSDALRNI
jgi:hypothetical protein